MHKKWQMDIKLHKYVLINYNTFIIQTPKSVSILSSLHRMPSGTKTLSKYFDFFFLSLHDRERKWKRNIPNLWCKNNFYSALPLWITKILATIAPPQSLLSSVQTINHWHMFKQTLGTAHESSSTLDKYLSYFHLGHNEKEFIRRSKVYYFSEEKGKCDKFKRKVYTELEVYY